jgi:hypothetical protein
MVELQIVVLAVAGSSPVGHPPDGTRTQCDYPARQRIPGPKAIFVELAAGEIIPSVTHRRNENAVRVTIERTENTEDG